MNSKFLSLLFFFLFTANIFSQEFKVIIEGLKAGDSARVTIQKSSESLFKKWAKSEDGSNVELNYSGNESLSNGKWALSIDATGYTYPTAKVLNIPNDTSASITLTELLAGTYKYTWQDDDSAAGHSTQSYYSEPTNIVIVDNSISVPNDYASIKLRNDFGVVLSDDIKSWSKEDSYRLYKMFSSLPFNPNGENNKVDFSTGEGVRGIFYLTDDEQYKDLTLANDGDLVNATISQSAFTYASPLVVTVDGIKGKFYSKRLYHAVVNYITEFASNDLLQMKLEDGTMIGNHPEFIKAFANIADFRKTVTSEDTIKESAVNNRLTPADAQAQIDAIMNDKSHAYWDRKNPVARQRAVEQVNGLYEMING